MGNGISIGWNLFLQDFKSKLWNAWGTTFGGNHLACGSTVLLVLGRLNQKNIIPQGWLLETRLMNESRYSGIQMFRGLDDESD